VLVVEDDAIVALEVAESLRAAGFAVLGPTDKVARALQLVNDNGCHAAVLDINLGRETSEPVATLLRQRGTPFVTVSGYAEQQRPDVFAGSDFLAKPLKLDAFISVLRRRIAAIKVP
jgi:DNA-binding response OmpR family regulator